MISPIMLVLTTGVLVSGSVSHACELRRTCAQLTACEDSTVFLRWSGARPDIVHLDDMAIAVLRIEEDTVMDTIWASNQTFTITAPGPALLITEPGFSGAIRPIETAGEIEVNIMETSRRTIDYAKALAARRTYRGTCEGLF